MPGDKKHHTDNWRKCVDEVMSKGHDESSASAICTVSLQNAGKPIYAETSEYDEMKTLESSEPRELHLCGATGQVRYETLGGRKHLVVPIVALMEGVIHPVNAETPEFVSASVLEKAAASWIGKPVTLGHPAKSGKQCSAGDPDIRKSVGIGVIMKSAFNGKKLLQEAWIDEEKAKTLHPKMYETLAAGGREEVSVGAYVVTSAQGGQFGAKPYKATWLETQGDHLAFSPGGRGACSCEMGCGTHRAAMHFVAAESIEPVPDSVLPLILDVVAELTGAAAQTKECAMCKGLGNLGGNPCDACDGEGTIKTAVGARHSSSDTKMIQAVHDHAMALGATCDRKNLEIAEQAIPPEPQMYACIRREGTKWVLYSTDGVRVLASHDTEAEAKAQHEAMQLVLKSGKT